MSTPKSRGVQVADLVVTTINAQSWSQALTAERTWIDRTAAKDLKRVKCLVRGGNYTGTIEYRNGYLRTHEVIIIVKRTVDPDDIQDVDSMLYLVESIADYFGRDTDEGGSRQLVDDDGLVLDVEAIDVSAITPSPEELDEDRVFASAIGLSISEIETFYTGN